ncbi:MAG: CPBP family intramembrane metalloprotease [bacterium]|nr:MAG: CPBP family intramembrane metalloprotease [bacterium]
MGQNDSRFSSTERAEKKFRFMDHPWISLVTFLVVSVLVLGLTGTVLIRVLGLPGESRFTGFLNASISHVVILFLIVPFLLKLPKGTRSFKRYLNDIGLTKNRPLTRLLLLAISCYAILALSQAAASIIYRLTENLPITSAFLRRVFDISGDLPPQSLSPFLSLPSAFEEIGFRGVILTLFLARYARNKSIVIAASAFALLHLLNLLSGRETVWVIGQLGWSFFMGVFYGYLFVKTGSLLPPMLVHYLGNVFIGSFTGYMQELAPAGVQAVYGLTFSLGVVPVTLMLLWVRFFARRWPFPHKLVVREPIHRVGGKASNLSSA